MEAKIIGDTDIVLRAILNDEPGTLTYYGGGAQCGINLIGKGIIEKRLGVTRNSRRTLVGNSIGALLAAADAYGVTREIAKIWPTEFCNRKFIQKSFRALLTNTILDIDLLHKRFLEVITGKQTSNADLYVGHTDFETGRHRLHCSDLTDHAGTALDVVASCSMPLITKVSYHKSGRRITDGSVGSRIPVEAIKALNPSSTLIVLAEEPGYKRPPWSLRLENYLIRLFSVNKITPEFWECLRGRDLAHDLTLTYLRAQLQIPLGSPQREMGPFAIAFCPFHLLPLLTEETVMRKTIPQSMRFWNQAFSSVK